MLGIRGFGEKRPGASTRTKISSHPRRKLKVVERVETGKSHGKDSDGQQPAPFPQTAQFQPLKTKRDGFSSPAGIIISFGACSGSRNHCFDWTNEFGTDD
jgi:hypothetical protein